MSSLLVHDDAKDDLERLFDRQRMTDRISWHDVLYLRQALYQRGRLDLPTARLVFELNRSVATRHSAWFELYLEVLTDCFLDIDQGVPGVSVRSAACLLDWIGGDVPITDLAERRLLLRLLLRSERPDRTFRSHVLAVAAAELIHGDHRVCSDAPRQPGVIDAIDGVIDAIDLQLVRRLVHGAADQETPDVDPEVARFLAALWAGIDPGAQPW
jgi:hypothetical protein